MDEEYPIVYENRISIFINANYWLRFNIDHISLLDRKKENGIDINYDNIYQVIKIPFSFTSIQISCYDNILKDYTPDRIKWFPPKPIFLFDWVHEFRIHSFKRNEILKNFEKHGVRTKLDKNSIENYYNEIKRKQSETF